MHARVLHVWELFMPGQFVEPHRYLTASTAVKSFVVAAQGVNVESSKLPNINCYSQGPAERFIGLGFWRNNLRRLFSPLFWTRYNRFCGRVAREVQPDVIHAHFGTTAARILPALSHFRVPAVVSFYGSDASASLRSRRWRRNYVRMLSRYDRIIVLCPEVKDRLVDALGCDPEKILLWVLPGGIEDYPYQPRPIRKDIRFIMAARFTEKKGHRFLLEAFRGFMNERSDSFLTLVGYGPDKHQIEEMVVRLGLQKNVTLIDTEAKSGFPALYYRELLASDICIQPSITASSGDDEAGPSLSMVCAQASGLPVICTRFVGVGLSMRDGETGYYCEESNSKDLLLKMKHLGSQPERWLSMGKAGSDLVHNEFSLTGQMKKLEGIYSQIAHSKIAIDGVYH